MIPEQDNRSESFYVDVLRAALRDGALKQDDRVLVVCGSVRDEASLREAGLRNFEMSNIGGEVEVDVENLPYADASYDAVIVH